MHNAIAYPVETIRRWIEVDGRTQQQIADELARTLDSRIIAKLIYKVCHKHGIKCQRTGPRSGSGHPDWKGGRTVTKNGYVKIYCPEHHSCIEKNARRAARANGKYYAKEKYVWEHWLVAEKMMGRPLQKGEVVHHRGAKDDNRPRQLMPFPSNAAHLQVERTGLVPKWTEAGKARIRAGVEKAIATYRRRRELGAPTPHKKRRRLTA